VAESAFKVGKAERARRTAVASRLVMTKDPGGPLPKGDRG
jgi:hypothetical protein